MNALVTGASSGIGLAICGELARRKNSLLMVSNEEERLVHEAAELEKKFGISAVPVCMDLAKPDSAQKLFEHCEKNRFSVDILVNNAGIFFFKDVIDTPPELAEKMINLHINTPVMLTRLFAQKMIAENRKGFVLNIASIASRMMMPGIALYSSTKSFIRAFSRAMRNEVFGRGVSITTLSPGAVATSLYNLPARYMKLGVRLGIIIRPERLAKFAVNRMLRRKAEYIPGGLLNRFFILLVAAAPEALVRRIKKKIDKAMRRGSGEKTALGEKN